MNSPILTEDRAKGLYDSSTIVIPWPRGIVRTLCTLSSEFNAKGKTALRDIITAFSAPEHATRIAEAKNTAGNDMLLHMQLVFPLATQIQQVIIQNYGFPADRTGLLQFTLMIKMLEKESQDISQLNEELRSWLIPSMVLPYSQTGTS